MDKGHVHSNPCKPYEVPIVTLERFRINIVYLDSRPSLHKALYYNLYPPSYISDSDVVMKANLNHLACTQETYKQLQPGF